MGPFLLMDEIAPKHSFGKGVLELADGRVGTMCNSSCWPDILPNVVWIYSLQLLLEPVALQTGKQQGTIIQSNASHWTHFEKERDLTKTIS